MKKDKTNMPSNLTNVGRVLVAHRKVFPYTCVMCGHEGEGYKGKQVCSKRCKGRKRYQRNKAQRTIPNV